MSRKFESTGRSLANAVVGELVLFVGESTPCKVEWIGGGKVVLVPEVGAPFMAGEDVPDSSVVTEIIQVRNYLYATGAIDWATSSAKGNLNIGPESAQPAVGESRMDWTVRCEIMEDGSPGVPEIIRTIRTKSSQGRVSGLLAS